MFRSNSLKLTHSRIEVVCLSLVASAAVTLMLTASAHAHNGKVSISVEGGKRCIESNGLPNHSTGQFPNRGNPNRISKQSVNLCVTTNPRKGNRAQKVRGSIGVGINGVQFRPGTADYFDPGSRRGFSRDNSSGWNLDGLGARTQLGMDNNNAHVDHRGLYHYHGVSNALVKSGKGTLIGWAADGFEIHYLGDKMRSGYKLKSGTRPSGPGGKYDGTYVEDWTYVGGGNTLDRCNGGTLSGKFVYFATDTFPFLPHCLWGDISQDFVHGREPRREAGQGDRPRRAERRGQRRAERRGQRRDQHASMRRGAPRPAIRACRRLSLGDACNFYAPRRDREITGQCRTVRGGVSACVPDRGARVRP